MREFPFSLPLFLRAPDAGGGQGGGQGGVLDGGAGGGAGQGGDKGGGAPDWTAGLDEGGKAFIATKGYKSPGDLVKAYQSAEKMIGADKIALPGKDAKPEEWDPVWNRLGRPEKPEGYKLTKPDKAPWYSDDLSKAFMIAAHKAGITQGQAAAMHDWYVGDVGKAFEAAGQAETQRHAKGREALTAAWGTAFKENLEFANRVVAADADLAAALKEIKLDSSPALAKLLAAHGRLIFDEDEKVGGGAGAGGFNLTPEQAEAKIKELNASKEHRAALYDAKHPGHQQARELSEQLYKLAYPEGSGA